jgi:hypothetical protein
MMHDYSQIYITRRNMTTGATELCMFHYPTLRRVALPVKTPLHFCSYWKIVCALLVWRLNSLPAAFPLGRRRRDHIYQLWIEMVVRSSTSLSSTTSTRFWLMVYTCLIIDGLHVYISSNNSREIPRALEPRAAAVNRSIDFSEIREGYETLTRC